MHLTDHEVALAIPVGVILGAVLSLLGQRMAATVTLRGQRQLAEDERIFEKRASVYVELIKALNNIAENAVGFFGGPDPDQIQRYNQYFSEVVDLQPSMIAFSSPKVRESFDNWFTELQRAKVLLEHVDVLQSGGFISDVVDQLLVLQNGIASLIRDITADLGISVPKEKKKRVRMSRNPTSSNRPKGQRSESET